ncbi:MAG TPA: prepilin-type N-terminal cleavage/methylation domain-containing protein [Chthoniobacteraceae bacterium]|nr:prepilin-type N-terminal cleavage/methylation domain-containing protein [Chthoniobacteraceae bacterium]
MKSPLPARPRSLSGRHGFTWIELLVALVVVGVLAAFFMGAAGKALASRKIAGETANFRMIGGALHGYLADHNQVLPPNPTNKRILAHYLGLIPRIEDWGKVRPGDPTYRLFISKYDERPEPSLWDSYAKNMYMGERSDLDMETIGVFRYNEIVRPARKLFLIPAHYLKTYHPAFSASATRSPFIDSPHQTEYKGPFPALFVDGHVETVEADPARAGTTAYQIRIDMILPRR